MDFLQSANWAEALEARTERPDALPVAGGTDVLVELNSQRCDPPALLDLGRVPGLADVDRDDGWLRLGAAVTFHDLTLLSATDVPALAQAARTVGSQAGAIQCGFCTPGMVLAAHDLLQRVPDPAGEEIAEALAGNLCRCTGYQKIIAAVRLAAGRINGHPGS